MVKTKIIETTEKYDKDGKLVEKITREETTEDNEERYPPYITTIPNVAPCYKQWEPYCSTAATICIGQPSKG